MTNTQSTATLWTPLRMMLLVLGIVVVLAMIALGVSFLGQVQEVEDNQALSDVLVDFSERPITSLQRDVLVLVSQLEDPTTDINDIRWTRAVASNRLESLRSPEQRRVRTDEVNAAINDLINQWSQVGGFSVTRVINDPTVTQDDIDSVIADIRAFEAEVNAVSLQNEASRQSRAAELDNNTIDLLGDMRTILGAFALTTILLILFSVAATVSITRAAQEVFALNTVLEQRVRDRTRDLQIATDVSRQITTILDLDTLITRVARETTRRYELDGLMMVLLDEEANFLNLRAIVDKQGDTIELGDFTGIDLDAKPSLVARVAREKLPIAATDVASNPDYMAVKGIEHIKSEAVMPMMVGPRTLGVMLFFTYQRREFSDDIMNALGIVANQTAVAIRNAELFAEARAARQAAEDANRAKSQFLAAMSHELRTPMNSVLNFTQFVISGMFGEINDQQRDALDKSYKSGEHLLGLINDVLDISKIESNALQLYVEENIPVAEMLGQVSPVGQSLVQDGVEFITDIEDDIPPIMADRQRLGQVLINLVSNACKFTSQGKIELIARKENDTTIRYEVRDTGPGIAKENQDTIFQLFNQTKVGLRKGGGTGLGLPIARRLAEAHDGTLTVISDRDKGATFVVLMPFRPPSLEKILAESQHV